LPGFEKGSMLSPIKLTPEQEELYRRLYSFNQRTIHGQDLSNIFRGAIFAIREECRSNPDWMAQSAHSMREILYLFKSKKTKGKKYEGNWIDAFRFFGSITIEEEEKFQEHVGGVYTKISKIAHHQLVSTEEYERLIEEYQEALLWALTRQVDVHKEIDSFFSEFRPGKVDK